MTGNRRASLSALAVVALIAVIVLAYNAFVVREPEWLQDVMLAAAVALSFGLGALSKQERAGSAGRGTAWRPGPSYVRSKMVRKAVSRPSGRERT